MGLEGAARLAQAPGESRAPRVLWRSRPASLSIWGWHDAHSPSTATPWGSSTTSCHAALLPSRLFARPGFRPDGRPPHDGRTDTMESAAATPPGAPGSTSTAAVGPPLASCQCALLPDRLSARPAFSLGAGTRAERSGDECSANSVRMPPRAALISPASPPAVASSRTVILPDRLSARPLLWLGKRRRDDKESTDAPMAKRRRLLGSRARPRGERRGRNTRRAPASHAHMHMHMAPSAPHTAPRAPHAAQGAPHLAQGAPHSARSAPHLAQGAPYHNHHVHHHYHHHHYTSAPPPLTGLPAGPHAHARGRQRETEQYAEPPHRRAAVDADASPQTTAMPPPPAPPPPAQPPPAPPPPLGEAAEQPQLTTGTTQYERDPGGCVNHTWRRAELPARPMPQPRAKPPPQTPSQPPSQPQPPSQLPTAATMCCRCSAPFTLVNYSGPDPTCFPCRRAAGRRQQGRESETSAPGATVTAAGAPAAASHSRAASDARWIPSKGERRRVLFSLGRAGGAAGSAANDAGISVEKYMDAALRRLTAAPSDTRAAVATKPVAIVRTTHVAAPTVPATAPADGSPASEAFSARTTPPASAAAPADALPSFEAMEEAMAPSAAPRVAPEPPQSGTPSLPPADAAAPATAPGMQPPRPPPQPRPPPPPPDSAMVMRDCCQCGEPAYVPESTPMHQALCSQHTAARPRTPITAEMELDEMAVIGAPQFSERLRALQERMPPVMQWCRSCKQQGSFARVRPHHQCAECQSESERRHCEFPRTPLPRHGFKRAPKRLPPSAAASAATIPDAAAPAAATPATVAPAAATPTAAPATTPASPPSPKIKIEPAAQLETWALPDSIPLPEGCPPPVQAGRGRGAPGVARRCSKCGEFRRGHKCKASNA